VDLLPLPGFVKKDRRCFTSGPSRLAGGDFYLDSLLYVKRAYRLAFAFRFPSRVGGASTPARCYRQEKNRRSVLPFVRTASSLEGALLLPLLNRSRQPLAFGRTLKFASAFVARGRSFYPFADGPVKRGKTEERTACSEAPRRRGA
jgi:hypothetical protein